MELNTHAHVHTYTRTHTFGKLKTITTEQAGVIVIILSIIKNCHFDERKIFQQNCCHLTSERNELVTAKKTKTKSLLLIRREIRTLSML